MVGEAIDGGDDGTVVRGKVATAVAQALHEVCGGEQEQSIDKVRSAPAPAPAEPADHASWSISDLGDLAENTTSLTSNGPHRTTNVLDGKPHDVEARVALSYFHRSQARFVGKKRKRPSTIRLASDLGLVREVGSPLHLARLLSESMEPLLPGWDIRPNASGIICIVSPARCQVLRDAGRLPCPDCVKWCKGEKGLWWHRQREHQAEHSVAAASAAAAKDTLAIIPYESRQHDRLFDGTGTCSRANDRTAPSSAQTLNKNNKNDDEDDSNNKDIFECCRRGDLPGLKQLFLLLGETGFNVQTATDRKGAFLVHWAAGSGHLQVLRYLVDECGCSPEEPQRGKRGFRGRTPLHWSARNGHLHVVKYLVVEHGVDLEAATVDGTTAFCWACWQSHTDVMG